MNQMSQNTDVADFIKDFCEDVIRKLIPEDDARIELKAVKSTKNIIIQIDVDKPDRGRIIGKSGSSIGALNSLCIAIKNSNFPEDRRKVILEIIEEEEYIPSPKRF